ncbi:MAG: hypothetical protein R3D26_12060 [Cyanobacteriota/Melainabacteria group bacterium]
MRLKLTTNTALCGVGSYWVSREIRLRWLLDRSITSGDSAKKPAEDSPRIVDTAPALAPAQKEHETHSEPAAKTKSPYEGSAETWVKSGNGGSEARFPDS